MTSFSFFKYFDAFELDVNVVNFVYNGKTPIKETMTRKINTHSLLQEEGLKEVHI